MKYEEFTSNIKKGMEELVKDNMEEGVVVIRNVMKNNNVSMKSVSIVRKGENATPTIYLKNYYKQYRLGRSIDSICEEIFRVYKEGISSFKAKVNIEAFEDFQQIKDKVYYKLINYDMNQSQLKYMPHIKFTDLAIVFFFMIECNEDGQATALINNQHIEGWGISKELLKVTAFKNTWNKYPPVIKPMEEVISDMIIGDLFNSDEEETDGDCVNETCQYGGFEISEVRDVIREEVDKIKHPNDIEMYVLTNTIKTNGAACVTYPGVIKEFAREHDSDVYIIPSSVHEVVLIPGMDWDIDQINDTIMEVNESQLDPTEVLSNHVYVYRQSTEEITY